MSNEEDQRTTTHITPSKRKCSFDSKDSLFGIRGEPSISYSENWEDFDVPYVGGTNYFHGVLRDISKSIHPRSKRYIEGWSPTLNYTTEAFFSNYQSDFISWTKLFPNTRIPRYATTNTSELKDCCIIEVDLESVEVVNESTREIILLTETVVGQLTREALLVESLKDASTKDILLNNIKSLIKNGTESTVGPLPYIFRTLQHQLLLYNRGDSKVNIVNNHIISSTKLSTDPSSFRAHRGKKRKLYIWYYYLVDL